MRQDERETLRRRFGFRGGYSGVHERDAGAELTLDHFQPSSHGGRDEPENWVYCCHACNEYKGSLLQPGSFHRILHPLPDDTAAHMVELEDGTIKALSETGTFQIATLHLNRRQLVACRLERRVLETAYQTQASLLERLRDLERQIQTLTAQLQQLESRDPFT
jgi:hypothetical protein